MAASTKCDLAWKCDRLHRTHCRTPFFINFLLTEKTIECITCRHTPREVRPFRVYGLHKSSLSEEENKRDTSETRTRDRDPMATSRVRYHCATPAALKQEKKKQTGRTLANFVDREGVRRQKVVSTHFVLVVDHKGNHRQLGQRHLEHELRAPHRIEPVVDNRRRPLMLALLRIQNQTRSKPLAALCWRIFYQLPVVHMQYSLLS